MSTRQSAHCCQMAENGNWLGTSPRLSKLSSLGCWFPLQLGTVNADGNGRHLSFPNCFVFNDSSLAFFRGCHAPLWLFLFNYIFGELILLRKSNSQPPGWLSGGLAARWVLSLKAHKSMDNAIEAGHKKEDYYLILNLTSKSSYLLCSCSRLLGSFYIVCQ